MGTTISVEEGISGVSILVDDESIVVLANDPYHKLLTVITLLVIIYYPYRLVEQRNNKYYDIAHKEIRKKECTSNCIIGYEYLIGAGTYVIRKS